MKKVLYLFILIYGARLMFSQAEEIEILTYHTHAPFITAESTGLTYDLAEYLTDKSMGKYRFQVLPMSRTRVDRLLQDHVRGIVPWVNPHWFDDGDETLYLWTENILMTDGNAVISSIDNPLEYEGPDSVRNLRFGGVRGHHYLHIDDLVESGAVARLDNENHVYNFRMLIKDRIDFTITPLRGAQYMIRKFNMEHDLFISEKLHSSYVRKIIIPDKDVELLEFLELCLSVMDSDEQWLFYESKYK